MPKVSNKMKALVLAAALVSGAAPVGALAAPSDSFAYDQQAVRRAKLLQTDEWEMSNCILDAVPRFMFMRSRSKIKATVRSICVAHLVGDGFITLARASAICDQATDREIDENLKAGGAP